VFQCAVKGRLNRCQGMVATTVSPRGFCRLWELEVTAESSSGISFCPPMIAVTGSKPVSSWFSFCLDLLLSFIVLVGLAFVLYE